MGVIPSKIIVGFNEREETFTGKLGYVCYLTGKTLEKVKQEQSFYGWIDEDIPTETFDNEPTTGFVLNRSAGGNSWGWNGRTIKARVYDPRGFEFEIDMENILYILEYADSYKGKALEGEFVYAWMGSGAVSLIPVNSPAYIEHFKHLNTLEVLKSQTSIKKKDLISGQYYLNTKNQICRYFGSEYNDIFDTFEVFERCGNYYQLTENRVLAKTMVEHLEYLPSFIYKNYWGVENFKKFFNLVDEGTMLSDKIYLNLHLESTKSYYSKTTLNKIKVNDEIIDISTLNEKTASELFKIHPKTLELLNIIVKGLTKDERKYYFREIVKCLENNTDTNLTLKNGVFNVSFVNIINYRKLDMFILHNCSQFDTNENRYYESIGFSGNDIHGFDTYGCYAIKETNGYKRHYMSDKVINADIEGTYKNIYYCEI